MRTPPPAIELIFRNSRRARRAVCTGHLAAGGSSYSNAARTKRKERIIQKNQNGLFWTRSSNTRRGSPVGCSESGSEQRVARDDRPASGGAYKFVVARGR